MVRNLLTVMLVNLERKQPSAPRAQTSVYTVKIFRWCCSNYASKTKDPPLSKSSKVASNPSVSSMSVMPVGSWFQSLMVLG